MTELMIAKYNYAMALKKGVGLHSKEAEKLRQKVLLLHIKYKC